VLFRNKLIGFLLSLCVVSIAGAYPVGTSGVVISASNLQENVTTTIAPIDSRIKEPINFELATLDHDFLNPPKSSSPLINYSAEQTKALPAAPAAVLMTALGLLCVSCVRDRKAWARLLVSLFWLGQTGILAVPQLALSMCQRTNPNSHTISKHGQLYFSEKNNRLRSDINGTKYIGLLHYLEGIPQAKPVSQFYHDVSNNSVKTENMVNLSQFANITVQTYLTNANNCTVSITVQHSSFYPAFILESLARGPPI
jgi:hypothetical protein